MGFYSGYGGNKNPTKTELRGNYVFLICRLVEAHWRRALTWGVSDPAALGNLRRASGTFGNPRPNPTPRSGPPSPPPVVYRVPSCSHRSPVSVTRVIIFYFFYLVLPHFTLGYSLSLPVLTVGSVSYQDYPLNKKVAWQERNFTRGHFSRKLFGIFFVSRPLCISLYHALNFYYEMDSENSTVHIIRPVFIFTSLTQ